MVSAMRTQIAMKTVRPAIAALLTALALAGCSGGGFGGPKHVQPVATVDPNLFPSSYRQQVAALLQTQLTNRADFANAMIAAPTLKPVAESPNLHYVVCVQLNGYGEQRTKVVIFLGGTPAQYIDATPQQCGDAAYQQFQELQSRVPK
jgi:hypothetical protein